MTTPLAPSIGGILSADIAVPEHERQVRFYARVLTTGQHPLWREDLMNDLGMPIIGLGQRIPEYAHLPLQWMPHIQVADVAASATRAVELGGSELMHGKDDDGASQWAVLQDPDGAAFGVMPVVPAEALALPDGAPTPTGPMGRITWVDLTVPDAAAARDFYSRVVGWSAQDVEREDGSERYADFRMLAEGGVPAAGLCHARGANLDLPPVWLIHLPVGDLAESVRRVGEEGGEVIHATEGDDGRSTRAVIRDLVGAHVALVPA